MPPNAEVVRASSLAIWTIRSNREGIGPSLVRIGLAPRIGRAITREVGQEPRIPTAGLRKLVRLAGFPSHGLGQRVHFPLGRPDEHGMKHGHGFVDHHLSAFGKIQRGHEAEDDQQYEPGYHFLLSLVRLRMSDPQRR